MQGLFGSERSFADGSTAVADENYIRQSLMEPNAQVVEGFAPAMPVFAGRLDDEELNALIAYIQSLAE
jgi:cytochrome c oxidase subunit 2